MFQFFYKKNYNINENVMFQFFYKKNYNINENVK
jgi:hypothetical protein